MVLESRPAACELALETCGLFTGLSATQRNAVASFMTERQIEPGATIVREGDVGTELIVILEGTVEVTKRVAGGASEHRLSTLSDGATLGERIFVDHAPRSESARALTRSRVGVLSIEHLMQLAARDPGFERQLLHNLAGELSRRVRLTSVTTVAALEQQLELEHTRALMGRFVVFLAFTMVTYAFGMKLAADTWPANISPSAITIPITLVYAALLYDVIRRSRLPFALFGLTFRNAGPVLREALLWTVGACALAVAFKLALIRWNPAFAHERLFNLSGVLDPRTTWADLRTSLALAATYVAVAPLQEFIVRGGLQTSLQRCLVGRYATAQAIVVSNALFASAHLHLSVSFALVAFFVGLLWGALFARQRNLLGVAVSHALCGWFAFLILGFEPWY